MRLWYSGIHTSVGGTFGVTVNFEWQKFSHFDVLYLSHHAQNGGSPAGTLLQETRAQLTSNAFPIGNSFLENLVVGGAASSSNIGTLFCTGRQSLYGRFRMNGGQKTFILTLLALNVPAGITTVTHFWNMEIDVPDTQT